MTIIKNINNIKINAYHYVYMFHNDNNPKVGTFAIVKRSHKVVSLIHAVKGELYECPKCEKDVIFKHGQKIRPYFCHKNRTDCSNYATESEIHIEAKNLLQKLIESRKINLNVSRNCKKCNNKFLFEYGKLLEGSLIIQEQPFIYRNSNRRADLASVSSSNEIECIFEICHTNKTDKEKRPEPWFEFDALYLCDKLQNIPDGMDTIELPCIREGFTTEEELRSFCMDCELDIEESQKGKIYFNQRGAGCGKTYESIQLINGDIRFIHKTTYIFLTKMRSAKDVIYGEFENQFKRGALPNFKILQKENCGNQYLILLEKPDKTLIKVIIGTIDSFTYAIREKNKVLSGGSDCFQKLVKEIRDGKMTIGSDGSIRYASTTAKLTKDTLVIIDEGQDLEKEYIEAFTQIIDRTGIDTYIIGDKLQSILSEKNLFTHLEDTQDNRIMKDTGKNIIKRCHNIQFQDIINSTVSFGKYHLPPIEGICSNPNCGYVHEDTIKPYTVDTGFENIFQISPEEVNDCIKRILLDMMSKIQNHGYLPNNFMFVFPIINEKNRLLALLYPAIHAFWIDFFKNPESYTELIMENMKKDNQESGYWTSKIENKENDPRYYHYVFLHRSETNQPINLNESTNSTKMLSIHAAKGNGCECVYLLGLSEFTLACHTGCISNTLVYESLFHVGMTRQKKYLFIGIDGGARDDICRRFGGYYENTGEIEPYIKNINEMISMKYMASDLTKHPFFDEIQENVLDYQENRSNILPEGDQKELVDWGHHIFRFCTMKVNIDKYLWNIKNKQQIAKVLSIINPKETKIIYSDYNQYKKDIKELYKNIESNKENKNKENKQQKKCLIVPILVFYDERSKTDYSRYRKIIKSFCDRVLEKLKSKDNENSLDFCPIECLIYCHLMEMIQHPYNTTISIMDIYRIISCYDDCYRSSVDHEEQYKCKCNEHFCNTNTSFVNPHKEIQKSIMNHHESITRIKNIIEIYDLHIRQITKGEKLEYNIDKFIKYDRDEFYFNQQFNYIGCSDNFIVFMVLTPQFNTINYYDILTKLIIQYFFLQQREYDSKKRIYTSIITLDSSEPITIDLTDLFLDVFENIKSLLKDYLIRHFEKEHTKIYDFFIYHCGQKENLKIQDKTDLAYVCDIFKKTETKIMNNKPVIKRIYPLPNYIINCFTEMDKTIMKNKAKRLAFKADPDSLKKYILDELNESLEYTVKKYLGISHIDSDDYDDNEN